MGGKLGPWLYLAAGIASEVVATSALKLADGFTRPFPVVIVFLGYFAAFYFFSVALRSIPVGTLYAIWAGTGMLLMALIGTFFFRQPADWATVAGTGLIIAGVIVLAGYSHTTVE